MSAADLSPILVSHFKSCPCLMTDITSFFLKGLQSNARLYKAGIMKMGA